MNTSSLTFLGATGTVTGSKFLLTVPTTSGGRRILVDCGQFQGEKELRLRNWAEFPVDPASITDVLLTHAHMDHCGYLPALTRAGFTGPIWCTAATVQLAEIVLRDAGHLQEQDAADAAREGYSKHQPPRALYDTADVEAMLPQLTAVEYERELDLGDGITACWTRAGHILGSASVRVATPDTSVIFSGDLGRRDHPVLRPREIPEGAVTVLVESTYGDREHPDPVNLPHEALADAIRRTVQRGGSVLIPAFAVDRTEVVLQTIAELRHTGRIPAVPVFVNSPMALAGLRVYRQYPGELRADLDVEALLHAPDLHEVQTADESRALTGRQLPSSIIISSSGMATGGRVLHHLERMLPDDRNTIVLAGYQAAGTRGRMLAEGAKRLKMHGRYVGVRAEIVQDHEFSVHADASDLIAWLAELRPAPTTVFCVHGEADSTAALAARIERELGLDAVVPTHGEIISLAPVPLTSPDAARSHPRPADQPAAHPAAHPAERPAAAPAAAPAATGSSTGTTSVRLDAASVAGARVESDLTAHPDLEGGLVLEGTIRIHLKPFSPASPADPS